MIGIVDYGVGNLFSLRSSLAMIGADAAVTSDADSLRRADRLILPGVGAFGDAAAKLRASGLDRLVTERAQSGTPVMGICLGMQLLFERGLEFGTHAGLGLLHGTVAPLAGRIPPTLRIPHIGWNALRVIRPHPLLKNIRSGDCVYFIHSYAADDCADSVIAAAEYGIDVPAVVARGNVMGCQFHPEKSGEVGLRILRAFCETEEWI